MPTNVLIESGSSAGGTPAYQPTSLASASFQQQGAIEWVDLFKSTATFSLGVLSRLSAGKLDPYTVLVGQAICGQFKMSQVGRRRLSSAVENLKGCKGVGDVLWYGFGITNVVRSLVVTEEGVMLSGLCAALAECYSPYHGAEILSDMVRLMNAPRESTPSVSQWKELLVSCSGILATTDFPRRAETFINFSNPQQYSTVIGRSLGIKVRGTTSSNSIAEALLGIASVSSNRLQSITLYGVEDAGWLAAVAEWIFSLRVTISKENGETIYTNYDARAESAQVQVIYADMPTASNAVQCVGRTYMLENVRDVNNIFLDDTATANGRVAWSEALSLTFSLNFEILVRQTVGQRFGLALGCAAKALTAVVKGQSTQIFSKELPYPRRDHAGHGQGLLHHMLARFSELEPVREYVIAGHAVDIDTVSVNYAAHLASIQRDCNCKVCSPSSGSDTHQRDFCFIVLVEVVLRLSISLSGMIILDTLLPRRVGLEKCYFEQLLLFRDRKFRGSNLASFISKILNHTSKTLAEHLIVEATMIFGGNAPAEDTLARDFCGASVNGICAWSRILNDFADLAEVVGLIQVIPGHIEFYGRPYNAIIDLGPEILKSGIQDLSQYSHTNLAIRETVSTLQVGFNLSKKSSAMLRVNPHDELLNFCIGPSAFAEFVVDGRRWTSCDNTTCTSMVFTEEAKSATDCGRVIRVFGKQVVIVEASLPERMAVASRYLEEGTCIWRSHECLSCCLRALINKSEPLAIFSDIPRADAPFLPPAEASGSI